MLLPLLANLGRKARTCRNPVGSGSDLGVSSSFEEFVLGFQGQDSQIGTSIFEQVAIFTSTYDDGVVGAGHEC